MGGEPLAGVAAQRETIDDQRRTFVDHLHKIAGEAIWMDRRIIGVLLRPLHGEFFIVGAHLSDLFEPRALPLAAEIKLHLFDFVDDLAEDKLGVANDTNFGGDMPPNTLWSWVHLNVRRFVAPSWRFTKFLTAPVFKADRQHHIRIACEGFFPGTTNC